LALASGGCASWPGIVDRETPAGQDTSEKIEVQGLRQAMGDAAELGGSLQLFLVHGMSNHPFGPEGELGGRLGTPDYPRLLEEIRKPAWRAAKKKALITAIQDYQFNPLVERLAGELGVRDSRSDPRIEPATLEWLEDDGTLLGYQLRWPFEGSTDHNGRVPRFVVHLNSWAMVTIPHKVKLLGDDNHAGRRDFLLNRGLKEDIAAAVAQGALRPEARDAGLVYWLGLCQVLMLNVLETRPARSAAALRLAAMLTMGLTGLGVAEPRARQAITASLARWPA
jgi:hypothetical protein